MDPNATLAIIMNPKSSDMEKLEAIGNLLAWLLAGGAMPTNVSPTTHEKLQLIMGRILDTLEGEP